MQRKNFLIIAKVKQQTAVNKIKKTLRMAKNLTVLTSTNNPRLQFNVHLKQLVSDPLSYKAAFFLNK